MSDTPRTDGMETRHPLTWFNEFGRWSSSAGAWRYFARQLEREVAELLYVVEKAAEWDADNTDNTDLAALGAYARAALSKCHAQDSSDRTA